MGRLSFELPAPAKINLFLNILGRRVDGYHELQTVFQLLNLCDTLGFAVGGEIEVIATGPGSGEIVGPDNLVERAARRLQKETGFSGGARIEVTKRIPVGAGMGGGSSDAATALAGLNALWDLGMDTNRLAKIAGDLGADVPVFVVGHSAWAEGTGERIQPLDLPDTWYVVVHPHCSVSTGEIFNHPDLTRSGTALTIARFLAGGAAENACEPLVRRLYPAVDEALVWLSQWGPAKMTGTGSCVFLGVETRQQASEIADAVPRPWTGMLAKGLNESPLLSAIEQIEQVQKDNSQ